MAEDPRDRDELERMKLHTDNERFRLLISNYTAALDLYHSRLSDNAYALGRLDERLGS